MKIIFEITVTKRNLQENYVFGSLAILRKTPNFKVSNFAICRLDTLYVIQIKMYRKKVQ